MDFGLRVSAPSGSALLQAAIRHTAASDTAARTVARCTRGSILIPQTTASTRFGFLGFHWTLPLGVAILLAAVCGGLITVAVGTARIVQLRRVAKQHHATPPVGP